MAWSQVQSGDGSTYYVSDTGETSNDPSVMSNQSLASQPVTAQNVAQAYQQVMGTAPTQDWINQTVSAYNDPNATVGNVIRDTATAASASGTPFTNTAGDPNSFAAGAQYYQNQGYIPGGTTYEGVPTSFVDPKTGKVVAQYGVTQQDQGGTPTSYASSQFQWNPSSSVPQGYTTALAIPQTDYNTGLLDALKGVGMVAATIGGAGALDALGGAAAAGAGTVDALGMTPGAYDTAGLLSSNVAGTTGGVGSGISSAYMPATSLANAPSSLTNLGLDMSSTTGAGNLSTITQMAQEGAPWTTSAGMGDALGTGVGVGSGAAAGYNAIAPEIAKDVASWGIDPLTGVSTLGTTLSPLTSSGLPIDTSALSKLAPSALKALTSALTSSGASSQGSSGQGASGQGSSSQGSQSYSANGPWNNNGNPLQATELTWSPTAEKPITAGDANLQMLLPNLDPSLMRQFAMNGMIPSGVGGQSSVGNTQQPSYYTYGSPAQTTQFTTAQTPLSIDKNSIQSGMAGYAGGGGVLASFRDGGQEHVPEFITGATGHYVKGRGDGQSDDIPAMLAEGEYVIDSSAVSTLGNGSSDAGAKLLDAFRESLREHTRSAPKGKIPPKASPLQYMKEAMHKVGMK